MSELTIVLGLLAAVAFLASVGRRAALADPIIFALGGLLLALVPGVPHIALPPSLVLVVFLPPLIYAAAQDTSWVEVKRHYRPILRLAVGLVLVTMTAVAVVAHTLAPELPWAAAFALGAIVSPPDAVAANAIATTLKLPRRLVAILEGEGLFNDATALVAFQVAVAIAMRTEVFAWSTAVLQFLYAAAAAVAIGLAVGWIGRQILVRAGNPAAETTITLLLPFAAYLPADDFGASGVLAVLTLALYLSRFGNLLISFAGRVQGRVLWEMIDFLLTGLSFILVGLQLPSVVEGMGRAGHSPGHVILVTVCVCLTVIIVRPLWIFGSVWIVRQATQVWPHTMVAEQEVALLPKRALTVLSWAGMRGVVSLAVALSLPPATATTPGFPARNLVIFVTFCVILVTLVGQGLTLPALIRRVGLLNVNDPDAVKESDVHLQIARTALAQLDSIGAAIEAPLAAVEQVRGMYADRMGQLERERESAEPDEVARAEAQQEQRAVRVLMLRLLDIEQRELQRLYQTGRVDTDVERRVQEVLDTLRVRVSR